MLLLPAHFSFYISSQVSSRLFILLKWNLSIYRCDEKKERRLCHHRSLISTLWRACFCRLTYHHACIIIIWKILEIFESYSSSSVSSGWLEVGARCGNVPSVSQISVRFEAEFLILELFWYLLLGCVKSSSWLSAHTLSSFPSWLFLYACSDCKHYFTMDIPQWSSLCTFTHE